MKMLISLIISLGIVMYLTRFMMAAMPDLPGFLSAEEETPKGLSGLGNAVVDEKVTVYRWTDEQGNTHFGSAPPTGQGEYETKVIAANSNLMKSRPAEAEDTDEEPEQQSQLTQVGKVYSPEGIKELLDNTQQIQQQLNQRMAEQQQLLNDLSRQQQK